MEGRKGKTPGEKGGERERERHGLVWFLSCYRLKQAQGGGTDVSSAGLFPLQEYRIIEKCKERGPFPRYGLVELFSSIE